MLILIHIGVVVLIILLAFGLEYFYRPRTEEEENNHEIIEREYWSTERWRRR